MAETSFVLDDTILSLLEKKKYATLKDIFITILPVDLAAIFAELPSEHLPILFRLLPKEQAAQTFVEMESDAQEALIRGFSDNELKEVIDELYVDDAVDLVEEMPANVVNRILAQADPETRKMINELLQYPENSAGSIMTTEFVYLRPEMTAGESILSIRRSGMDKETVNTCYITDNSRHLTGSISLRSLVIADEDTIVSEIMKTNCVSVTTMEDQETVANLFAKYDVLALPVVDKENRLVGIVTVDDAIDVMQEEATEDMEKMAAMTPTDKPYLKTGVFSTCFSRIPWLLLLMISSTFTGMIITHFETALQQMVVLTAFIPMLIGTGGNSGSQSSVAIIRSLSLGEVEVGDLPSVIWKEIRVSVLCGVILAFCNFAKMMLVDKMLMQNPDVTVSVCLAVCFTLIFVVLAAKTIGCVLPVVAQKIGLDPAVMASPFITTIVDALSLLIYFRVAVMLLPI